MAAARVLFDMELMKAFVRSDAKSDVVALANVPVAEVADHEVLVQVRAFGVGLHDRYFIPPDARFPYVIGTEAAGVVLETGTGVETFGPGDRVLLSSALNPKGGSWAELTVVGDAALTRMPDELDFPTAAGLPVAGKTAVESLRTLDLRSGETLFVAGASGAIGTLVIQMATAGGIRVAGSASARNHDYLLSLGAEKAVDYNAHDWQEQVRQWAPDGVDAALAIQPGTGASSQFVVREDGHVVTVSGDVFEPEPRCPSRAVRAPCRRPPGYGRSAGRDHRWTHPGGPRTDLSIHGSRGGAREDRNPSCARQAGRRWVSAGVPDARPDRDAVSDD